MPRGSRRRRAERIGLALAGGGPVGAVYEIGALRALEEALPQLSLDALEVYVGVSAGSFVAAALANGFTAAQLVRGVAGEAPPEFPFSSSILFTPAYAELGRRALMGSRLLAETVWRAARRPAEASLARVVARLSRALPIAIFDNEPLRAALAAGFRARGRADDFRRLRGALRIIATDLDSGAPITFGEPGWDDVPISRAVQASTALPGIYPPVAIDGHRCVDGVLLRTVHASVALEHGVDLLLCINPIVPIDVSQGERDGLPLADALLAHGLPALLSQTFRMLVHSRMKIGFASYHRRYPHSDLVLFEPEHDEHVLLFANILRFSHRRLLCDYAYRATRRDLRRRAAVLGPLLARHGLHLDAETLGHERDVWQSVGVRAGGSRGARGPRGRLRATIRDLEQTLGRLEASVAARRAG